MFVLKKHTTINDSLYDDLKISLTHKNTIQNIYVHPL